MTTPANMDPFQTPSFAPPRAEVVAQPSVPDVSPSAGEPEAVQSSFPLPPEVLAAGITSELLRAMPFEQAATLLFNIGRAAAMSTVEQRIADAREEGRQHGFGQGIVYSQQQIASAPPAEQTSSDVVNEATLVAEDEKDKPLTDEELKLRNITMYPGFVTVTDGTTTWHTANTNGATFLHRARDGRVRPVAMPREFDKANYAVVGVNTKVSREAVGFALAPDSDYGERVGMLLQGMNEKAVEVRYVIGVPPVTAVLNLQVPENVANLISTSLGSGTRPGDPFLMRKLAYEIAKDDPKVLTTLGELWRAVDGVNSDGKNNTSSNSIGRVFANGAVDTVAQPEEKWYEPSVAPEALAREIVVDNGVMLTLNSGGQFDTVAVPRALVGMTQFGDPGIDPQKLDRLARGSSQVVGLGVLPRRDSGGHPKMGELMSDSSRNFADQVAVMMDYRFQGGQLRALIPAGQAKQVSELIGTAKEPGNTRALEALVLRILNDAIGTAVGDDIDRLRTVRHNILKGFRASDGSIALIAGHKTLGSTDGELITPKTEK